MAEAAQAEDGALPVGAVIGGRYRVEAEIGAGAMGRVYRVVHDTLELPLALKLLHAELAIIPEVRQRLAREAKLSAWLDHPSLVQVTDFGIHEGRPFIVMRLVEGEELARRMERGPISPPEAIKIGKALCEGLAHAHGLGLVHRDLKPDNVVLTARGLRILDFGLARAIASDDPRLTRTGLVCGTPRYMSPEQASGDQVDPRSDVYAVGVLLHEMLRGEPMFDGPNAAAVLRRQIVDPPPELGLRRYPGVDIERLTRAIGKALAKDPAQRYGDALSLAVELEACRGEVRRRRAPAWWAAAALAAVIGLGGFVATQLLRDPLVEARAAYATGQMSMARQALDERLRAAPDDAAARLLLGHVHFAEGRAGAAARAWSEAIKDDPELTGDAQLLDDLPAAVSALHGGKRRERARGDALLEAVAQRGGPASVALLARLTAEAPTFRLRRQAFEGLERLTATDAIDELAFLSNELTDNRTNRCDLRRWYVERLAALGEPSADALVEVERKKRRDKCFAGL